MRTNMLEYMGIFVQVVEQGSFTRAADTLQLHRPAVSKAIQQLEDELGVKLLHRTTRKLNMTAEGDEFYQRARQVLADVNDMMASFSPTQPPRGRLRLDAPLALAHTIIIPAIAEFQAQYPDIDIVLSASDKITDLITEGVDCVIRLGELEDSSFVSRRLGQVRMATCASPDYIRQYGQPNTPDDLAHHKAVNFFSEHSREVMNWKFVENGEVVSRRPVSNVLVNNSDVLLSSGLAGLGILHALRAALEPYIRSGDLVELLPGFPTVPKPVSVLWPNKRYLSPNVRVFIDWISELFRRRQDEY
ncbi:TPA: LysR family transcriptional regulator [Salmonella bongori]|uniref:Putative transcription regulator protein n=2 Tax=Salmonella bongori TaxID=54736 RepID=S5MQ82_SALBN|nr:LysR family transcriptional regulator [Salmonella bongori]AGR58901.1 putative transcription regulator protein [Salmonella bongori N268-08]ECE6546385.1 LysR family transcriptional regulator [Salmonella bongori]ECI3520461.1 LysR family transcriptional regulator [Salmonella bongori]EDP8577595.1 LysR family transcriptional regulator [Salmonella bongori]EDP8594767.1 LysR family transcriptional regulator [Salmonella bongori]